MDLPPLVGFQSAAVSVSSLTNTATGTVANTSVVAHHLSPDISTISKQSGNTEELVSPSDQNMPQDFQPHLRTADDSGIHPSKPKSSDTSKLCEGTGEVASGNSSHDEEEQPKSGSESSETSSSPQEELQKLSLQNRTFQPHRDHRATPEDAQSTLSTASSSYLENKIAVRQLVKRSVARKWKQQQRHSRPRKVTRAPTAAGRRSKKDSRTVVKQEIDAGVW